MSFSDAFNYPFRNLSKIMQIVLIFAIMIAVLVMLAFNSNSMTLVTLSGLIGVIQGIWLSGYGIRVIRAIMRGDDYLPSFEFINDIGRGIVVGIASIIYFLPLIFLFVCVLGAVIGPAIAEVYANIYESLDSASYGYSASVSNSSADGSLMLFCGLMLFVIPVSIALSWMLLVGMMRYADEERTAAMFEFGENWRIVSSNLGLMLGLVGWTFLMGILYGIVTAIINGIYQTMFINNLSYRSSDTEIIAILVGSFVVSTTLSILSQFSGTHLIAQRAEALGIGVRKHMDDDYKSKRYDLGDLS